MTDDARSQFEPVTRDAKLIHDPTPVGVVYLGTMTCNDEPSSTFDQRRGRCYELAAFALAFGDAPKTSMLVHGSIHNRDHSKIGRIAHAWLVLPGGLVWEPITRCLYTTHDWNTWAGAKAEHTYTLNQTRRMIFVGMHYGPWEELDHP